MKIEELKEEDKIKVGNKTSTQNRTTSMLVPQIKGLGLEPKKVIEEVYKLSIDEPTLKDTTQESLVLAVARGLSLGLSPDKVDGEIAIIPYKQGLGKAKAQLQVMWKGYKKIIENYGVGIKELKIVEIKDMENDISNYKPIQKSLTDDYSINGEFELHNDINSTSIPTILKRQQLKTIAFLALLVLDEKEYKHKNFGCLMTLEQIKRWKETHMINTKINDFYFGRKTTAKKVIRDFKPLLLMKTSNKINDALKVDGGSFDTKNEIEYLETKGDK